MKRFVLIFTLLLSLSCSDDNDAIETQISACFDLSKNIVEVGEEVQVTNCTVGAISYEFDFGNGTSSTENTPKIAYESSGEFTIKLKVTSEDGKIDFIEKNVTVNSIENNYIFTPLIDGDFLFPIDFNYSDDTFYYIENYQNILNAQNNKYNHVEIDLNTNSFTKKYISDRQYNSGNAFEITLNNNDKLIYTNRSLSDRIGLKEVKLNSDWEVQSIENNTWRILYGALQDNENYLYYGAFRDYNSTNEDFSLYKTPAIDIRNNLGEITQRMIYNEIQQGFIGDLIKTENGFIAFGGITEPLSFSTFNNYRPLIIFLNSDYEYISHKTYEDTAITALNHNNINGSFHITQLANTNFVIYSHNEFRIINASGDEILKENLPVQSDIQGLVSLDNGFVISTSNYLKKYDSNGNLIKSLKFNGQLTPNLILKENQIYFMSGYDSDFTNSIGTFSIIKAFLGAVDTDLNIINLNE